MKIAVVGATGAVGREMCTILEDRGFPASSLTLWASARSAGTRLPYRGEPLPVGELAADSLDGSDVALFSAGSETSRYYARHAADRGTVVIDNSSAFRMDPAVPLVIPEINPEDAAHHRGLIANPNCSTIIMAVAVWPLHRVNPVRRLIISTYQAASGAGAAAMAELQAQTRDLLDGKSAAPRVLPYQAAFNLFSHNSAIDETGYNQEERKMVLETRKIFHDDAIHISATCVRVPILRAHSEAIHATFERPISENEARHVLSSAPGITVIDDRDRNYFPMPIEATGRDHVLVGRIRQDTSDPAGHSIAMWVSGDQLRKGAALNAVQIADLIAAVG